MIDAVRPEGIPMNPLSLSPERHAALHDAARRRAQELHDQAIEHAFAATARWLRARFAARAATGMTAAATTRSEGTPCHS